MAAARSGRAAFTQAVTQALRHLQFVRFHEHRPDKPELRRIERRFRQFDLGSFNIDFHQVHRAADLAQAAADIDLRHLGDLGRLAASEG